MSEQDHPAVSVIGPTASGKTSLATRLAGMFDGEVISCDALQVYRHMNIGTAKTSPGEQGGVMHHMLDLREPDQDFSAGDYLRLGRAVLADIRERGHIPFVTGGTGFYLRALIDGLFDGPGRSEELRARLQRVAQRAGPAALHRLLRRIDPETAGRIAAADGARALRALEVYLLTGETMHRWQERERNPLQGYRWLKIGLRWEREQLYGRINRRVEEMFRMGLVGEVRSLLDRYPKRCHAFKAIGYRQVIDHLDGRITLQEAILLTQQASRRYAKRQITWFRSDPEIRWIDAGSGPEHVASAASGLIEPFLRKARAAL